VTQDPSLPIRFCPRCGSDRLEWRVPPRDDRERQVCEGCGYTHYVGPALAAGVILHDESGRFCLVRRALPPGRGLWTFPGGFVDVGEEPTAAALRETEEETGHAGAIEGLVGVYSSEGPRGKPVVIVVYRARSTGETGGTCEEVDEVRWFSEDELPWGKFAFASTEQALRDHLGR
jgi:ADP-ribose pyrophosphatase YjhB (NUDIX family)